MALRPQLSFCHGINDRESMIKRTLTKIKTNRQGEGEIMVDAEEIQMEANGRHGGEIEEKNRFPTPTTTMIQLTNACKNSTLMRVELESLAPVL